MTTAIQSPARAHRPPTRARRPKLLRDPIHDIISFDLLDPVQSTLFDLLNTPEMQRLRRIRQLGMSFFVYHGAEHSRFSHSMGVCHLAQRAYGQLYPGCGDDLDRLTVAAAAMLHDVGHGAFSHVMERITRAHHEQFSRDAIRREGSELHGVLSAFDASAPERVASLLQKGAKGPLAAIVSSQLDVDRMDYILRDRLMTGVKIGTFDLERILGMMEVHDDQLTVNERAIAAVEGYLLARFHMYKQVYLHKATRSAERMLAAAFHRVAQLHADGFAFRWTPDSEPMRKLAFGEPLNVQEHLALDDFDVWHALKRWALEQDPILARLAGGLMSRDLYKTADVAHDDPRGVEGAIADALDAVVAAGGDPRYELLVDSSLDSPYNPYRKGLQTVPISLINRRGVPQPIENVSDIIRMLGEHTHVTTRLCFPAYLRDVVRPVAGPDGAPSLLDRPPVDAAGL